MDRTLEILLLKVRDDLTARRNALTEGQCGTFDQYRELTGIIRGLILAEQHIIDLARTMGEADD
jgi:hypothetical protein